MALSRLAPSPTGTLHLGNARTFLVNWALARQRGWRIVLRIEDLDAQRVRPGAVAQTAEQLRWLGLDWDGPVLVQSADLEPYQAAMRALAVRRLVFACKLTRRDIRLAASAPHAEDGEVRFPPELRPPNPERWEFKALDLNYRFAVEPQAGIIEDRFAGRHSFNPSQECGDFIVWTKAGAPAYQLAVVVDDMRQDVTDVVRGDDLLPSAARQALIHRALGAEPPNWWHLPLVLGPDGRRLAKRLGDSHLAAFQAAGSSAEPLIGLIALWCGMRDEPSRMSAAEFLRSFDVASLPRQPVTFTQEQLAWLNAQ